MLKVRLAWLAVARYAAVVVTVASMSIPAPANFEAGSGGLPPKSSPGKIGRWLSATAGEGGLLRGYGTSVALLVRLAAAITPATVERAVNLLLT